MLISREKVIFCSDCYFLHSGGYFLVFSTEMYSAPSQLHVASRFLKKYWEFVKWQAKEWMQTIFGRNAWFSLQVMYEILEKTWFLLRISPTIPLFCLCHKFVLFFQKSSYVKLSWRTIDFRWENKEIISRKQKNNSLNQKYFPREMSMGLYPTSDPNQVVFRK